MKPFKTPSKVVLWYITGLLKEVKSKEKRGTLEDGFLVGIIEGEQFVDEERDLPYSMKIAIDGLKLQDPKIGLAYYPEPNKVLDKKRKEFLRGYIRGLVDTLQIFTFKDYKTTAILAMQTLGLE